jgi:RNA polymerase sigma-B factor
MAATTLPDGPDTSQLGGEHPHEVLHALAALPPHHPSRPAVREQAIEAWLPLAAHIARRFAGKGEPVQDLIQTATVGLIKAVDRFNPEHGNGFVAFAVPTIAGELKRYFRDQTWDVHVPRHLQELRLAVVRSTEQLAQQLGHLPSPAEVADALHLPEDEVREGIKVAGAYTTASLDVPARDTTGEGGPLLSDVLGEEDNALALAELRVSAAPAVAALPERDRRILHLRFFANLTQDQIAAQIGISQMHVSRLLARALDTLRDQLREPSAGARDQGTPERGTAEPGRAERGTGRRPPDSARLTEPPARRGVSERPPGRPPIPAGAAVPTGAPERGNHDRGAPGGRAGPGRRRRRGDPPR